MTRRQVDPPRLAEWLLAKSVPSSVAGRSILGDAREEYIERLQTSANLTARIWYWKHALSIALHFIPKPRVAARRRSFNIWATDERDFRAYRWKERKPSQTS